LEWGASLDPPTRAAIIGTAATFISVAFALLGVWLNLRWNRRKHREDRALALKHEAYLNTSDAIAEAMQWIALVAAPNTELASGNSVLLRLAGALNKLHILGDEKTISAVIEFQRQYLVHYVPMVRIKGRMTGNAIALKHKNRQLDTLIAAGNQGMTFEPMKKLTTEIEQLRAAHSLSQRELLENAVKIPRALGLLVMSLILELRREFELPIDSVWYQDKMRELATFSEQLARDNIVKVGPSPDEG
jgi:hypothetical protein